MLAIDTSKVRRCRLVGCLGQADKFEANCSSCMHELHPAKFFIRRQLGTIATNIISKFSVQLPLHVDSHSQHEAGYVLGAHVSLVSLVHLRGVRVLMNGVAMFRSAKLLKSPLLAPPVYFSSYASTSTTIDNRSRLR